MNVRILTLFDDEPILPPEPVAVKRKRTQQTESSLAKEDANHTIKKEISAKKELKEITVKNEQGEKNYYTIGETANKFKVRTSHIRFWTVQFALKVRTTRKGDRLYTPENIEQLRNIHHLVKEQGFTIAGAKAKLKEIKNASVTKELPQTYIVNTLNSLRQTLIALRQKIEQL